MKSAILTCSLCHHHCRLADGEIGFCRARQHQQGRLISLSYGRLTSLALDPIEKKPSITSTRERPSFLPAVLAAILPARSARTTKSPNMAGKPPVLSWPQKNLLPLLKKCIKKEAVSALLLPITNRS